MDGTRVAKHSLDDRVNVALFRGGMFTVKVHHGFGLLCPGICPRSLRGSELGPGPPDFEEARCQFAPEAVSFLLDRPMLYKSHGIANVNVASMMWRIDSAFPAAPEPSSDGDDDSDSGLSSDDEVPPKNPQPDPSSMRHETDAVGAPGQTVGG